LLPSIPGQEFAARPGGPMGSQCLSYSWWSEHWELGRLPASASLGWCIVGSCARDWWGQPSLLGVKAALWSPSKASFTCPCYYSNKPGLTLSADHASGRSLWILSSTVTLTCWPCFWQPQVYTSQ
jgi:hypothetical protein